MEKEDIRIKHVIVHILDSLMGVPVLSDELFDTGSDFCDFLRSHIYRIISGDDGKNCEFYKEESEVFQALQDYSEENFVPITKMLAQMLYEIMNANIDIPPADLVIAEYQIKEESYLAVLKMNYKTFYTHQTDSGLGGNKNGITAYRALLPSEGQRLTEACVIRLKDYSIQLIEKKFEINGKKLYYFSQLFLKCGGKLSEKAKLSVVTKAVEDVQKKYYEDGEQFEVQMEAKSIIHQELEEEGVLNIPKVVDKIFKDKTEFKQEVQEKLDKYKITEEEIRPQSESTTKKFEKQYLMTDTGIELKIPMEQYQNSEQVQFLTNEDGTISVLIKNIGHIMSK